MSAPNDKSVIAIREAATEWAARLAERDLSHPDKVAFATWLRTSPVHVREYLNAEALRLTIKTAVQSNTTDVRTLLSETPDNVVVGFESANIRPPVKLPRAPWRMQVAAGLLLLVVGGALAWLFSASFNAESYSTGLGEMRRVALPDGSTAELNTLSKISVAFEADRRDIHLEQGEAFFAVAKDPSRPFRVLSDNTRVRAVGTEFSVYRKPDETVVTVVEGKVSAESERDVLELTAGHQAVIASGSGTATLPARPVRVDAQRVTSWRQHRLIFDDEPLRDVVAEFNRYNRQQLVIEDPGLAAQRISGVFDPDKPRGLVLFLKKNGDVRTIESSDATLVLTR